METIYKIVVKNGTAALKTLGGFFTYILGIKDVTGSGSVSNSIVDWSIQHKTKTTAEWALDNTTILLRGQLGVEDTGNTSFKVKVGNGTDLYSALSYITGAAGNATWGTIGGTLSNQTDLQNALNAKEPTITASGNVTDYWSGTKTFRNLATDVRAVVLTGLSLATNAAISASDTVLSAFGKLSARLEQWRTYGWSAGAVSGFEFTNNGDGTANIASGVSLLRTSVSMFSNLNEYNISAVTNQTFTDNATNYVYSDYNGGTPIISVTTDSTQINTLTTTLMYSVVRVGTSLYYNNFIGQNVDSNGKLRRRLSTIERFAYGNGAVISATNRKPALTAGVFFSGLIRLPTPAFDCNVADTFTYVYYNGSTYTRTTGQTEINNTQYVSGGVLTTMANNRFRTDFVYLLIDNPTQLWVVMGTVEHHTLAAARSQSQPANLPPELSGLGQLVGRFIIEKSATTMDISSNFTTTFVAGSALNHNDLPNIQGGSTTERYHLTAAEYAALSFPRRTKIESVSVTTYTVITTLTDEVAHVHPIPVSTVSTNGDIIMVSVKTSSTSSGNAKIYKMWINTTPDLSGSPVVLATVTDTTAALSRKFERFFNRITDTSLLAFAGATSLAQETSSGTGFSTVTVPSLSAGAYIVISAYKAVGGDTAQVVESHINIQKL